jgi:hypothetical protein
METCSLFDALEVHVGDIVWPDGSVTPRTVEFTRKKGHGGSSVTAVLVVPKEKQYRRIEGVRLPYFTTDDGLEVRDVSLIQIGSAGTLHYRELLEFTKSQELRKEQGGAAL